MGARAFSTLCDGLAMVTTEGTPGREEFGVRRYHERCYEDARTADPSLPSIVESDP